MHRRGCQKLSVGNDEEPFCQTKPAMLHELGHAMGFWHEQTRPDRDNYVNVLTRNIVLGYHDQFTKYTRGKVDSLGVSYDYDSIMHYHKLVSIEVCTLPEG